MRYRTFCHDGRIMTQFWPPALAIFKLSLPFDRRMMPWEFFDDVSNGSQVIMLTDKQTNIQSQTDSAENNATLAVLCCCIGSKYWRKCFLQYFDAVGWVFWPVKRTRESENRLQLDSVLMSVNIDCLTMVDNTSAVGNDSRPWVVPSSDG